MNVFELGQISGSSLFMWKAVELTSEVSVDVLTDELFESVVKCCSCLLTVNRVM